MKLKLTKIYKSLLFLLLFFSTYSSAWPCRFAAGKKASTKKTETNWLFKTFPQWTRVVDPWSPTLRSRGIQLHLQRKSPFRSLWRRFRLARPKSWKSWKKSTTFQLTSNRLAANRSESLMQILLLLAFFTADRSIFTKRTSHGVSLFFYHWVPQVTKEKQGWDQFSEERPLSLSKRQQLEEEVCPIFIP